jgi:signal transduction histidine kinase
VPIPTSTLNPAPRSRLGLTERTAIAGLVVAVLFVAQLLLTLSSYSSIRQDTREEQRAEQSIVAAIQIEKLILDVSSGTRGYALTHDPTFLASWQSARAQLPRESKVLTGLTPGKTATQIDAAWRSYLSAYAIPLVGEVRTEPAKAKAGVASLTGLRLISHIRGLIDPFVDMQDAIVSHDRGRVSRAERRGVQLEIFGAVLRILLFVIILWYLFRALVTPLRRIAGGTLRLTGGDLDVEVPEEGAGEVGDLARSFNDMARSLRQNRSVLEEQNVDVERLANVLRAVLDSTVDGILLSDAEGNVQLANRPIVTLTRDFGMSFDGPVVDRLLSVEERMKDREKYHDAMERLRDNPTEATFDEFEDTLTGRVFQGFTSPVRDDRDQFLGRVWTLREVTQQRELDRLKDEFVATVSHELRTPLTSMMGFLEMIREGEAGQLTDEQKRFLAIVYRSSERLQRLVGDLLFVARLDASGLQLQFGNVRIDEVVHDCVEASSALARSREIDFRAELAEVEPVWADRERLSQLVSNLISNAIKFTPAGGSVTARTFTDGGDAVIQIEDTGIGIPTVEQDRLFQRFFRSSTATEQAIPGTGLGLVISKAIAEAHGGSIGVRSGAGEGTCFTVRLPLEPEEVAA